MIHIETAGYISIKRHQRKNIEEWIDSFDLCTHDGHEDEIITDVDPEAIREITGNFISKEEADELIEKCDVIKFYC